MLKTLSSLLLFLCISIYAFAQWTGLQDQHLLVSNKAGNNINPVSAHSDDGSSIVAWGNISTDALGGIYTTILSQKISADGSLLWGNDLNPVIIADGLVDWDLTVRPLSIISDEADGVFIAWASYNQVGLQHVNAEGQLLWTFTDNIIFHSTSEAYAPQLCLVADNSGGVYISWNSAVTGSNAEKMYIRHYSASGLMLWQKKPDAYLSSRKTGEIISDEAGGIIACYNDSRSNGVYAQRISANGDYLWSVNGVNICTAPSQHYLSTTAGPAGFDWKNPVNHIISDGSGGAIIMFNDNRNSTIEEKYGQPVETNIDVYAQRINVSGNLLWGADGIALSKRKDKGNEECFQVISDATGGAIVKTESVGNADSRSLAFLQRINQDGQRVWGDSGIVITKGWNEFYSALNGDSIGNTYISSACPLLGEYTLRLEGRKINSGGEDVWTNGALIATTNLYTNYVFAIEPAAGGAIVSFAQFGSQVGSGSVVLAAAKILASGVLAKTSIIFKTIANGNWNEPAIWEGGVVPPDESGVMVSNNVVVNVDVICNTLKVEAGGSVKVNTGVNVTVLK